MSVLLLLPLGVAIGALTERLATRNPYILPSRLWNTAVKLTVATVLWTRFVCIHPSSTTNRACILPSSVPFLYGTDNTNEYLHEKCSSIQEGLEIIITLFLKCSLLYISTRFGASLQPVGLTGGIACGKSTVSKILRTGSTRSNGKQGAFAIIDVDGIAHDILVPGKMKGNDCAYHRILSAFRDEDILETYPHDEKNKTNDRILHGHGSNSLPLIDRRKLGDIIFRDPIKRRKLNSITHPLISKIMMKQIVRENFASAPLSSYHSSNVVAVDIPLLFEVGLKMKLLFAIKVVVACTSELQLERLIARNPDLTGEQCKKRIESQLPVEKKVGMADIVIWNNGSMDDLIRAVEMAREEIISRKQGLMGITVSWFIAFSCIVTSGVCLYDIIRMI